MIIKFCFRSQKHEFTKSSPTTKTTFELGQRNCYNALANPTYANIENILDEDVKAKFQADSQKERGEVIKKGTQGGTETMGQPEAATAATVIIGDEDTSDSAVNGTNLSDDKLAPSICINEGMQSNNTNNIIFYIQFSHNYRTSSKNSAHSAPFTKVVSNNSAKVVTPICYIWKLNARADGILNINL